MPKATLWQKINKRATKNHGLDIIQNKYNGKHIYTNKYSCNFFG